MSQFINTEHANEVAREAFESYDSSLERIKNIKKMINEGESVSNEELIWVCKIAEEGIRNEKSSWYDHG